MCNSLVNDHDCRLASSSGRGFVLLIQWGWSTLSAIRYDYDIHNSRDKEWHGMTIWWFILNSSFMMMIWLWLFYASISRECRTRMTTIQVQLWLTEWWTFRTGWSSHHWTSQPDKSFDNCPTSWRRTFTRTLSFAIVLVLFISRCRPW